MDILLISNCLKAVLNKYRAIFTISGILSEDSEPDKFEEVVRKRWVILSEVEEEIKKLDIACNGWRDAAVENGPFGGIISDIKRCVEAVADIDVKLQKMMKKKMLLIKGELSNFKRRSNALVSYTAHSMMPQTKRRTI